MVDIFTKPLAHVKFELFRRMVGVHDNPFSGELKIIILFCINRENGYTLVTYLRSLGLV